jgi:hypothetical protein
MRSVVKPEAKLYSHLPVIDFIIFNVASGLDYLKPVDVVQRLAGLCHCVLYRIFDAGLRGAGQLDLFVDVFAHFSPQGSFAFKKSNKGARFKGESSLWILCALSQGCHNEDSALRT